MRCKFEGEMTFDDKECMGRAHVQDSRSTAVALSESDVLCIASRAVQLYAERHPRPLHVNLRQAAEMLGLSRPTVRKLVHSGRLRFNACGLIPIEQLDKLLTVTR